MVLCADIMLYHYKFANSILSKRNKLAYPYMLFHVQYVLLILCVQYVLLVQCKLMSVIIESKHYKHGEKNEDNREKALQNYS